MKVLIVTNMVPFIWGGAEELASNLHNRLRALGVDADLIRIPFYWEPYTRIDREITFCRLLRTKGSDRIIAMKFPAYHIEAENKYLWLVHQYRQAYDLYGTDLSNVPQDPSGEALRRLIVEEDNRTFAQARQIFSISDAVSNRLRHFNGFESEPLRVPLNDPELFAGGTYGGYVLAAGRINAAKRQYLLVEAMRHLSNGRLVIAGPPDSAAAANDLRARIAAAELEDRVKLELRLLTREELARYVNGASAVAYVPFQEDSYGYVTMEAFEAGKPVITTTDFGEVRLIVLDGQTGFVVPPDPEALAGAFAKLLDDTALTQRMGIAGRALWRSKSINWPSHIERLLG